MNWSGLRRRTRSLVARPLKNRHSGIIHRVTSPFRPMSRTELTVVLRGGDVYVNARGNPGR